MKTVVLHPSSQKEFYFLLTLFERLNIPFEVKEETTEELEDPIRRLFGSWKSDESGDELIEKIYAARADTPREVNL